MNKEIEQKMAEFLDNDGFLKEGLWKQHFDHKACMLEFARWLGERWAKKCELSGIEEFPSVQQGMYLCANLIREDLK